MRVLIRGAGDIATGIALRLFRSHMEVVMTDLPAPTAIRRTVCFSQAIVLGKTVVEDVTAVRASDAAEAETLLAQGVIPVLADPDGACREALHPDAVEAVSYTHLRANIPGLIGGYAGERVLRAPADGVFHQLLDIGAAVKAGDVAGEVNGIPMCCTIDGVVRGILPEGTPVHKGMKSGDVDPRCRPEYCTTASDKALAVGGGVLEALLHLRVTAKQTD